MTDNIRIDSGIKRITINDDPSRVIEFNPDDVIFVERFYNLLSDFKSAEKDFVERAKQLDAETEKDEFGVPVNAAERIQLMKDLCDWCKEKIDQLFGEGTSRTVFGNANNIDMFIQFFEGITPFLESSRSDKLKKYQKITDSKEAAME